MPQWSRRRTTRLRAALVAGAVVALLAIPVGGPATASAAPGPTPGAPTPTTPASGGGGNHYVALGDSWAAGSAAGALDTASTGCRRSSDAYPPRAARTAAERFWVSRACASAKGGGGGNTQFGVLDRATRVVTATVGSDATGLGVLARACSTAGSSADCTAAGGRFDKALAALPRALDAALADMRRRAPSAVVTVAGYPLLAEGAACATGPADATRAARLDDAVTRLDRVLGERTAAARMRFVDVRPTFTGHGVCAADPWLAPLTVGDPLLAGGATPTGHARGYALPLAGTVRAAAVAPPALPPGPTTPPAPDGRSAGATDRDLAAPLFTG